MNRPWLVPVLIIIAMLVWGNNLLKIVRRSADTDVAYQPHDSADWNGGIDGNDGELTYSYSNPFRKGPEKTVHRVTSSKQAASSTENLTRKVKEPEFKFLGCSDNAAVIQTTSGSYLVVRPGESVEGWILYQISIDTSKWKDEKGNAVTVPISS